MTSHASSTAGVLPRNRRATDFSGSNSLLAKATARFLEASEIASLGAASSEAIRVRASGMRVLAGKRSINRVSVDTSLVPFRKDHAISAASMFPVGSAAAVPADGDLR